MDQTALLKEVSLLTEKINLNAEALKNGDAKARKEMLLAARSLYLAIETPMEAILRMEMAEPALHACLRVVMDLKIIEKMAEDDGVPKTTAQLAALTGANEMLLGKILKHLAAMSAIRETAANTYENTPFSKGLLDPTHSSFIHYGGEVMRHCTGALSAFLEKSKYEDSTDIKDCAWQMGMRTDEHLFPYLVKHPEIGRLFGDAMGGYSLSRARWFDDGCVDVAKVLNLADESAVVEGEKGKVMLVDVAGGAGHDIELFRKKFPEIKERLVLQDLPSVIEMYEKQHPDGVEAMAHDIFTAQPILGAKGYYLHSILHDWPAAECHTILTHLKAALTPGHSKILINEHVIPDTDAYFETTGQDIVLMAILASGERSEAQWRHMIDKVGGLKITQIWTFQKGTESLIEIELA